MDLGIENRWGRLLLPLVTSGLFAGSFIAGKYTTAELGPLTTTLLRYVIASLFLLGLVGYRGAAWRVGWRALGEFALLGLFGVVGYHYFFFSALHYTAVANTAIINAANPLLTAAAAAWFLGERLRKGQYAGVVLAVVGVLTLLTRWQWANLLAFEFNLGDRLMFMAVLCWVVYSLLVKRASARYEGVVLTFYTAVMGAVILVVLAWPEGYVAQVQGLSWRGWLAVAYMGIGASGIGYLLYNLSVPRVGPTRTSGVVYSWVPVWTTVLAFLFFGEAITIGMVGSALLVLLGLRLMMAGAERVEG